MSDLIKIQTPRALAGAEGDLEAINQAIATNISSGGITDVDLPRITVSGGGNSRFIMPTLEGEESHEDITAVIVYYRETRAYFKTAFGKGIGKQPPDCTSSDGITGKGKPGGECSRCPLAEYGSAEEGSGQACRQHLQPFVLCGDSLLPQIVSLPPTSRKPVHQFLLKLIAQGIPYHHALVRFELEKTQNASGIQYGKARLRFIRRLSAEEAAVAKRFHELCRTLAARVPTGLDEEGA